MQKLTAHSSERLQGAVRNFRHLTEHKLVYPAYLGGFGLPPPYSFMEGLHLQPLQLQQRGSAPARSLQEIALAARTDDAPTAVSTAPQGKKARQSAAQSTPADSQPWSVCVEVYILYLNLETTT